MIAPLNRIELDAVLDMDKPMPPDERLSRALGVIGLMGWQCIIDGGQHERT